MKELLENNSSIKPAQVGKIVEGKIIGRARSTAFLDLGPLGAGIIYGKEFQEAKDELKNLKTGDVVLAKIIDLENDEGYVELSLNQASNELIWERLADKKAKDETITVKISGANKGGLLAEVSGIPAFLPVSQLLAEHYPKV
ncbi:MAG: S1 RNA-binding domain-containing protein, partial [Parcubacteria group bacterium]